MSVHLPSTTGARFAAVLGVAAVMVGMAAAVLWPPGPFYFLDSLTALAAHDYPAGSRIVINVADSPFVTVVSGGERIGATADGLMVVATSPDPSLSSDLRRRGRLASGSG